MKLVQTMPEGRERSRFEDEGRRVEKPPSHMTPVGKPGLFRVRLESGRRVFVLLHDAHHEPEELPMVVLRLNGEDGDKL